MNSPHQREQLPDLLSDALDATQRARVESHLRECAQCARELRQLQQMQAAVAALPAAPVPVGVRANVRAQLRQKPQRSFVLPFAFPLQTNRLAWGGGAVVGAVGLMLLARPSLQNDSYYSAGPVSETELAAGANNANDGAIQDKATAQSSPQRAATRKAVPPKIAPKNAAPTKPAPPVDLSGKAPTAMAPLPTLPAPPASTKPRLDAPGGAMPSFAFPAPPAPLSPPKIKELKSRPAPPNAVESEPKTKSEKSNGGNSKAKFSASKNENSAPAKAGKSEVKPSDDSSSRENSVASVAKSVAPIIPPPITSAAPLPAPSTSFANGAVSSAGSDAAPQPPRAAKPNVALGRIAPPSTQAARASESASVADASIAARGDVAKWPGGTVKATLAPRVQAETRGGNADAKPNVQSFAPPPKFPMILTFSVAQPIGKARLILLTPGGEQTIWRGELNALPAQVKLSQATIEKASGKSGQPLRARLEQIGADDNPTSSSTFELLVP